ncbi:MAG: TadE/TadG family type IV pilus assembly protein [Bacillota bacterium]
MMKRKSQVEKFLTDERGFAVVFVSLMMTVLLGTVALVADVGLLFLNKNRLANACDAAALAGSQELPNKTKAKQVAEQYLQHNDVELTEAEVSIYETGNSQIIQVNSDRTVEFTFAKVLGVNAGTVNATSQAAFGGVSSTTHVVPFSIPDQELKFGEEYTLKSGAGNGNSGNYGALALGGNGANQYRENIINGYNGRISVGDKVPTEPGNMSGPTMDGVEARMKGCSHSCTPEKFDRNCSRLLVIPVYDPASMGNGKTTVKIVGFALFLLTGVDGHGNQSNVHGYFLQSLPPDKSNATVSVGQEDYGLHAVKLIK